VTRLVLCLISVFLFQLPFAQTTSQNASPWQRLEYACANGMSLTHVVAVPEQLTLIFNDAFYVLQQVESSDSDVRYEDAKLIWTEAGGVGRLEQKGGTRLAEQCVYQPDVPVLGYSCNEDITVKVRYLNDVAHINVFDPTYGDQFYELPKVISASGAKFSNTITTWFVIGEDANLFEETEEVQHAQDCKLQN
jgi:membrane-bound inhibitor of C-type lysozyme